MARARSGTMARRRVRPTPKPKEVRPSTEKVEPESVRLVRGRGTAARGGGAGGAYWHIYVGEQRAGFVFINVIDLAPFGAHASINIQVNRAWQGRGIGSIAYRSACSSSEHDVVLAHMRKSNVASRRAALRAGFAEVEGDAGSQLTMCWSRASQP